MGFVDEVLDSHEFNGAWSPKDAAKLYIKYVRVKTKYKIVVSTQRGHKVAETAQYASPMAAYKALRLVINCELHDENTKHGVSK